MTIRDAIAQADMLKNNQYPAPVKIRWLSDLDGQIYAELHQTHEAPQPPEFHGYDGTAPMDTELLVPYPYAADIYVIYLQACIAREDAEIGKYNQLIERYNSAYARYQNHYNRTHMPLSNGRFRF